MRSLSKECHPDGPGDAQRAHAEHRDYYAAIQGRLRSVTSDHYAHIGEITGVHAESVRRYMSVPDTRVPVYFVLAMSRCYRTNLLWLMTGEGPQSADQLPEWIVKQLPSPKLFSLIGDRLAAIDTALGQRTEPPAQPEGGQQKAG